MKLKRLRLGKKGEQESSSTGAIVAAVIAAVVLVLVIIGIWMWASGKALPFFSFLPGFNQTKSGVVNTEIFRYLIEKDLVQYYDGVKWNDFKPGSSIEANGRKYDYANLRTDLIKNYIGQKYNIAGADLEVKPGTSKPSVGYWANTFDYVLGPLYNPKPAQVVDIPGGIVQIKAPFPASAMLVNIEWPWATSVNFKFDRVSGVWQYNGGAGWGDVREMGWPYVDRNLQLAKILSLSDEATGYKALDALTFLMDLDGKVYRLNVKWELEPVTVSASSLKAASGGIVMSSTGSDVPITVVGANFLKSVADWRNSLINNPVRISYVDGNGVKGSVTTCYTNRFYWQRGEMALVVDLSNPLPEGGKCPYMD